jgi:hypothetical membrane protein
MPVLLGSLLAAAHYTAADGAGYSFLRQAISDLGVAPQSTWAWAFNAGMMASGLCMAVFSIGASLCVGSRLGYAIAAVSCITNIAMVCVGIFPAQAATMNQHNLSAVAAFAGILIMSLSLCLYVPFARQHFQVRWVFVSTLSSTVCAASFLYLLIATRTGHIIESELQARLGAIGAQVTLILTLEWATLGSVLLVCFSIALSLLSARELDSV